MILTISQIKAIIIGVVFQAAATRERIIANTGDAIRDGDGCQAAAIIERIIANTGDAIGNYDLF